ncbi:MAG: response regulator [Candidatus Sumerlaeia bacterium]|nr:response regulator [Candidatus Sumerlaeia bacterium]
MPAQILLVDDDPDIRDFLKLVLKPLHNVWEARHGMAAWKLLTEDNLRPDLIITDLVMPRMDGMELTEKIKSTEWGRTTPVFILTGVVANENIPTHVWKLGTEADQFLEKPIDPNFLLSLVDHYLKLKVGYTPLEPGTGSYDDDATD